MQNDPFMPAKHEGHHLIKQQMPYRHFRDTGQGTTPDLRCIQRDKEISAGRKTKKIAVISTSETYPRFFAILSIVSLDVPLMKPVNVGG
jgi:hypothetical protein